MTEKEKDVFQVTGTNFESVYKKCFPATIYFFRDKGFSEIEAQDLTQDVFFRVYEKWETLREPDAVEGWIRQIAFNIWKNKIRSIKTDKRDGKTVHIESFSGLTSKKMGPEEEMTLKEQAKHCEIVLEKLSKELRLTVLLYYYKNLKYREIATLMGVTMDTVKTRLHRAKQILRDNFEL